MPISVSQLFDSVGIEIEGKAKWGNMFSANKKGIYVIALSDEENNLKCIKKPIFNKYVIEEWINYVPEMRLDGEKPTIEKIINRLTRFWLPDETVIYIGKTNRKVQQRVVEYYRTRIGRKGPHSGGQWIKTLYHLNDLTIYWSTFEEGVVVEEIENQLLKTFKNQVSEDTKNILYDRSNPLPFGNLEHPKGNYKKHGFKYQRRR